MNSILFLQYNNLLKRVLSEEETLENIYDLVLDKKPNKEQKKALANTGSWAKYAYLNNKEYYVTVLKNDSPVAAVTNSFYDITVEFIEMVKGEFFVYIMMVYDKCETNAGLKKAQTKEHQNGHLFLSQINFYTSSEKESTSTELVFKPSGDATIFKNVLDKESNNLQTDAKKTKLNVSENYIRGPIKFDDYEYLLDYKSILRPEYLELR